VKFDGRGLPLLVFRSGEEGGTGMSPLPIHGAGGIAAVEVVHHGVELGDFLAALDEELFDLVGAFEAFEVVGGLGGVLRSFMGMNFSELIENCQTDEGR